MSDYIQFPERKEMTVDFELSLPEVELYMNIEMGFLVRSADKAKQIEELLKELVRMHVYKKIS